jgi:Flp pilus assembly protein TadD
MHSLKRVLVEFVVLFSGVGIASIGGLPGVPRSRSRAERETIWVDWGGSQLSIPEIKQSQLAFEKAAFDEAYKALGKVQDIGEPKTPSFDAQVLNNLAVSAYSSGRVEQARDYMILAAQIETVPQELSDAIAHNLDLIMGEG